MANNLIKLKQLDNTQISGFVTGILGDNVTGIISFSYISGQLVRYIQDSGSFEPFIVDKRTNQTISGQKTFASMVFGIAGTGNAYATYSQMTGSGYVLNSQTGTFIHSGQTGDFYPVSNTLNFISSGQVNTSGFATRTAIDTSGFATRTAIDTSGLTTQVYVNTKVDGSGFSSIKVTGSSALVTVNLSGVGGTTVLYDGTYVTISGGGSSAGNVTGFSNVASPTYTGGFVVSGAGSVTVDLFSAGTNITGFRISGNAGAVGPTGVPGPAGDSFINISWFLDFPYTGASVVETFTQRSWTFTGFDIGVVQSGLGPESTSAGTIPQFTGTIYQRDFNNTKQTIQDFVFNSGINYITSGGFSVTITGHSRVGLDIWRGLSGMQGLTLGIFGTGT